MLMQPNNQQGGVIRVAAYVRVSSSRQVAEGDSLEAQQAAIRRDCEARRDDRRCEVEYYIDAGRSAKNQNRPQLQRLRRDIEAGKVDVVMCCKLDRITRSLRDFADLWSFFETHDVDFVSLKDKFDTSDSMGRAMLNIAMVFAQLERELTGERTLATMHHRTEQGLWNLRAPYGYMFDPANRGKLIIDPEWGPIIREHFFNAAERLGSVGAVTRYLRENGIFVSKRKTRSGRTYGGRPFEKRQVGGILRNRAYLGDVSWGATSTKGAHEALIDADQFNRVQDILDKARNAKTNPQANADRVFLLKRLLRCGKCGAAMTPSSGHGRKDKHYYYLCTNRSHNGTQACDAPYVPAEPIEKAIVDRCIEISRAYPKTVLSSKSVQPKCSNP